MWLTLLGESQGEKYTRPDKILFFFTNGMHQLVYYGSHKIASLPQGKSLWATWMVPHTNHTGTPDGAINSSTG